MIFLEKNTRNFLFEFFFELFLCFSWGDDKERGDSVELTAGHMDSRRFSAAKLQATSPKASGKAAPSRSWFRAKTVREGGRELMDKQKLEHGLYESVITRAFATGRFILSHSWLASSLAT